MLLMDPVFIKKVDCSLRIVKCVLQHFKNCSNGSKQFVLLRAGKLKILIFSGHEINILSRR